MHLTPEPLAPRQPILPMVQLMLVVIGVVMLTVALIALSVLKGIKRDQDSGIIRGYKNRAVVCDMIRGLGITEPENCREAVIQPYLDKRVAPGSTAGGRSSKAALEVLCLMARRDPNSGYIPTTLCPK